MISVIIPLYNKEKHIANTLQTVFNQTFQDSEIVIVDDGSTDNSVEQVKKVNDSRIRLIHQENAGVSVARNKGIAEAKYNYIAFLDADDEWKPEYLGKQVDLIHRFPECQVYACAYELKKDEKITPIILNKILFQGEKGILTNYFEVASCSHPPLWTSAVVVKKEAIQAIGGFPVDIKAGEDLLTWARLAVKYKIAYNKMLLASFVTEISSKPRRVPAEQDIVGSELKALYQKNPTALGLKTYVSLWHKMRASIYMRLHDRKSALKETLIALKYNVWNFKLYVYLIILLMPLKIRNKFFASC